MNLTQRQRNWIGYLCLVGCGYAAAATVSFVASFAYATGVRHAESWG